MRVSKGQGWVDMGPTQSPTTQLPSDVRMPFRSLRIIEYTGNVSRQPDSEHCTIDTAPQRKTDAQQTLDSDGSRHQGVEHVFNAHPHAHEQRFAPGSIPGTGQPVWVQDPKERSGWRRIDILSVTLPHDCANHLTGPDL